jgi:hypothetical protein
MTRSRFVFSVIGAALAGLVGPEPAAADGNGGPLRITRPGAYRLHRDIRLRDSGAAVVITASGVSLDLAGHVLSGPGTQGTGILIEGAHGVSVQNGKLRGFAFGAQVVNAVNVKLQGLQIDAEDAGGPPPGEVGIMIVNSRGVDVFRNIISRVFLGIFVRGGGSGGNRIAENTLSAGSNGQLGICYNPDGLGTPAGPRGDLVYNNLVSGFNIGLQTSTESAGNIFRENDIAFRQQGVQELSPAGANVFAENTHVDLQ